MTTSPLVRACCPLGIVTDKATNFVFKNDSLQYILNEEGRARPVAAASGNDFVTKYIYDYFVKDHLGNVRSTITTQPITSDYLAGYEVGQANIEQLVFENVAPVRSDKPGSTDPDDVMAARLNGNDPTTTIGISLMLKVMPGDRFSIGVDAVYEGDYTQNNELTSRAVAAALMSTLTGGINYDGNATADIPDNVKTIQNIFGNPNLSNQLDGLMASTNNVNAPKAHLNYLFFDSKFNLVSGSSGAVQVQGGAVGWQHLTPVPLPNPGTPVCNNCLTPAPVPGNGGVIISPVPGYLVVYIDNQTIGKDVYFDHLMVEHYTSEVLEENHYYPFGLTVNLNQNTSVTANPYKLTTKELESHFDLNSYDFGARPFDMTIPVWYTSDQLAEKHYDMSPYVYCGDNPANRIDPTGMTDYKASSVSDANWGTIKPKVDNLVLDEVTIRPEKPIDDGSLNVVQAAQRNIGRNDHNRALVDQTNNVMLGILGAGGALPFVMAAAAEGAPIAVTSYLSNPAVWNGGAGTTILGAAGYATEMPGAGTLEGAVAEGETNYLYHYTSKEAAESISQQGLKVGRDGYSYLTNKGNLSGLQAQIELALPANRALPNTLLKINVTGFNPAIIRNVTGNMQGYGAGGGTEFLFNQLIPANRISIMP